MSEDSDGVSVAADWYPDPFGRHELRYWDGGAWTAHVATEGRQSTDQPEGGGIVPTVDRPTRRVRRDVERAGADPAGSGGGTIFTEPVLVVNQKAKLIEVHNEYAIFDASGRQLGAVRQVGQSSVRKVLRVLTSVDQFLTHHLQVVDLAGNVVLGLTRPAKLVKSRVEVTDATGTRIGSIVQQNAVGRIRFAIVVDDEVIGSVNGENWRAWNFNIQDASGSEVGRITKTFEGLAKTMFTTADNYVVQIHRPLDEPLRSMVVASSLAVDTALKQDGRGFG